MIKIDNLTFTYPRSEDPALMDLSLSINKGDFVLITGPSGSGKSTLLRCLNGLVPHFSGGVISGKIQIDGIGAIGSTPRALSQKVGIVFQDPESQSVLDSVEDEIAFVLENGGMPTREMHERVDGILDLLDLKALRNRSLVTLSGGERQKVAIAAAIVQNPPILVLDEPTSQLDWGSSQDLLRAVRRLNLESGTTIIIVEQRLDRVLPFASRLLVIESGQVTYDGPSSDGAIFKNGGGRNQKTEPMIQKVKSNGEYENYLTTTLAGIEYKKNGSDVSLRNLSAQKLGNHRPLLSIRGLNCGYGEENLLEGVSFDVKRGEAVALVGRNGTGKTTLLKSIVGLLKSFQGEILVDGRSIRGRSVADICKEVAYLPQMPDDLLFADSVDQELEVTLTNHGFDPRKKSVMVEHVLASLELLPFRRNYPRDLSVGQRQRVAMGSVMVTGPKLILLDEPTRGLDSSLKIKLVEFWSSLLKEGRGLLLVTHDLELAGKIADRILVLENGQINLEQPRERIFR
ncbi:MAG: ABC transporter ATP-binding protein [Anaerolineae bacterium]|nr:MAG: ABC transporter ATP-binding protein [Anaerolineae bacterium]